MKSSIFLALIGISFLLSSCIIQNPKPEACEVKTITVTRVYEGGVKDIVFGTASGEYYYINRGLEQGYTIDDMQKKVLHKKVTLHLAKVLFGSTTNHIAQLAIEDEVVFTEFD